MSANTNNIIPDRLDHLDTYLSESESRVSPIREGCEKKIVWHNDKKKQRDLAVVYLHGFSASRMEIWPLCDRLAEAMGANLFYTRLSGHGQDGHAMGSAQLKDWLADGMEAMAIGQRLGKAVVLVGTSTGATLATWLATQPSIGPLLHSLILISPNFFPKNPLAAITLWPPGLRSFKRLFGGWRNFTIYTKAQARYWTVRYPINAIATMMQLVRLSWQVDLNNANMPTLMMINPWDRVINVSLAVSRFQQFPSDRKKLVFFRGNTDLGRHVLAGDILAPKCTATVMGHIQRFITH